MLKEWDKGGDELLVAYCCNCSVMFGMTQAQWVWRPRGATEANGVPVSASIEGSGA
jgi:hypothetical protein